MVKIFIIREMRVNVGPPKTITYQEGSMCSTLKMEMFGANTITNASKLRGEFSYTRLVMWLCM